MFGVRQRCLQLCVGDFALPLVWVLSPHALPAPARSLARTPPRGRSRTRLQVQLAAAAACVACCSAALARPASLSPALVIARSQPHARERIPARGITRTEVFYGSSQLRVGRPADTAFGGAVPAWRTLARARCPGGNPRSCRAGLGRQSPEVARKFSQHGRLAGSSLHTNISPRPLGLQVHMGWWRPASRSRLVTGRSRQGGPYAVTACHGPSRPVTSLLVWSRQSRRRAGGPGPLRGRYRFVLHESPPPLEPLSAALPSVASLFT